MKKNKIRSVLGSLKFQLLLPILLVTIIIVFALTVLVSHAYTKTIFEQEDAKVQSSFLFTGNNITELMKETRKVSSLLAMKSQIEYYNAGVFQNDLDRVFARMDVLKEIDTVKLQQPSLYGMLVLRKDDSVFGSLPFRNYFDQPDAAFVLSKEIIREIRSGKHWIGPYPAEQLYRIELKTAIPEQVVMAVSSRHSNHYGTYYTLAIVDTKIISNYLRLLEDGQSRLYLITDSGEEIARAGTEEPLSEDTFSVINRDKAQDSFTFNKKSTDENVYVCYQRIDDLNWYLVRELPMKDYEQTAENLRMIVWCIAGAVLLVASIILQIWMRSFMKTFDALHSAIGRLRQGHMGTRIDHSFKITEFENIRQEFNSMNAELEKLMQTTSAMERAQLELELRNLQTQLSPHMIFNSITAIRWMAMMVGADRVADMLMELAEMLRPVFRDWSIEWSLGEELSHLKHYTNLLDLRYGNNFSINIDVPEELHSIPIPRFTFQPLVENTCEHNNAASQKICMGIRGWIEGERICFCVSDNGNGISPERLDEITRNMQSGKRANSVGLPSVYNRLRLCFGKKAQMRIICPNEGGTEIHLDWPLNEKPY